MWKPSVIPLLRVNLHMATISWAQDWRVWPSWTQLIDSLERAWNEGLALLTRVGANWLRKEKGDIFNEG